MIFALIGNQNSGKTTLFNQLTGANQHVGNFPGVTVEQKSGEIKQSKNTMVVDLPGIYSLRPYSHEEKITRDFVLNHKPDGIINIVDATNIERNLYLSLQLIELNYPMVIALNMMDEVRNNGGSIDIAQLSENLGVPIVPVSAIKKEGIEELVKVAVNIVKNKDFPKKYDFCQAGPIHRCIHAVSHIIEDHAQKVGISTRFAATKTVEGDLPIIEMLELNSNELDTIEHSIVEMEREYHLDRNAALADMRYSFIERSCKDVVVKSVQSKERKLSLKIDKVFTNKYAAIPLFLLIMLTIFYLTFEVVGKALSDLLAMGINYIIDICDKGFAAYGLNPVVHSLVIEGVLSGVGSVLSFLPIIVVLFFFLSILEDTGYMARVAFVMDKLLRKIGLSGRSIVPMLIGFGCTVPAIMATRTLSSERDRKMTILLTPYMSCSAKIPIFAMFTAAFFPKYRALVMIGLYSLAIIIGIIVALIMNKSVFRGKPIPFVMELPNYRFPSVKSVLLLMWEKARDFILKAFTIIFVATIIIWFLQTFDLRLNVVENNNDSLLALIGKVIAPLFIPLGFNDWRISTSLLVGFSAKEAVVSSLNVLLGTSILKSGAFTIASAVSFLIFTLLYTPCVAAVATMKKELKSTWKTIIAVVVQCLIAWIVAAIAYQLIALF
ncbi:MAG TPA: ferrous iron transport protein B [Clostridia bacterium]|nr:ferrous iron transport protein B [Clostridia bacterium]